MNIEEFGKLNLTRLDGKISADKRLTWESIDNGETLEICRVCTDGTYNTCSMLYGACVRVGRAMGYKRIITYTLESEHGSSVKAANFKYDGIAGGIVWSGKRRNDALPAEMKKRWVFYCK